MASASCSLSSRCGTSGLRSLLRWGTFGAGVVYGRFRLGHFFNVKRDMMIQQREAFEAENEELRKQISSLETDLYRIKNPDWNKQIESASDDVPSDELGALLYNLGFRGEQSQETQKA